MATMNISLPEPMREWVQAQTANGQYANSSDYIRDLIRRDQQRARKFEALQNAISEGLRSGEPASIDVEAFKKRMMDNLKDEDI